MNAYDDTIKLQNLQAKIGGKISNENLQTRCPCHDDSNASLSIKFSNGYPLVKCFAGCDKESIIQALNLEVPKNNLPSRLRRINIPNIEYTYHDRELKPAYTKIKTIEHGGKKKFLFKTGDKLGLHCRKYLFRYDMIKKAREQNESIFFVEGEKDVLSLEKFGLLATTNGGATDKLTKEMIDDLRGLTIILLGDNDTVGEKKTAYLQKELLPVASKLFKITVPNEVRGKKTKDVTDWIEAGLTLEELRASLSLPIERETQTSTINVGERQVNEELTDTFAAELFFKATEGKIKYNLEIGWMSFNGKKFEENEHAPRKYLNSVSKFYADKAEVVNSDIAPKYHKFAQYVRMNKGAKNILETAQSLFDNESINTFDVDNLSINLQNGYFDLRQDGGLRPHDAKYKCSKVANMTFDPNARCPLWESFIENITCGDHLLANYLQRVAGYSMTGLNTERAFFFLHGQGSNGKSVFIETIKELLGDYATTSRCDYFCRTYMANNSAQELARLVNVRLVAVSEAKSGMHWDEGLIKDITGGDEIQGRNLFKKSFTYQCKFKLLMRGNTKPSIEDNDKGMWSRVNLVPFVAEIPEGEQDKLLKIKLLAEANGIFNWMLKGLELWRELGMTQPPCVMRAVDEYRAETDSLGEFLMLKTKTIEGMDVSAKILLDAYNNHLAMESGEEVTHVKFARRMSDKGFKKIRKNNGVYYMNITLNV